ncbi:hypothetical protein [Bradyrhizobium valentinum]|uniref:hypothetical protein n=1 Tax=Bradyrhizobium valentinum TaxID=1518501 RepID=UPI00070F5BA3|nr:hypothetical protein [Bradyrhizobium valentinum]KRR14217.1 hypothetical protein CQ10_00400 [Bradyrhizobium valentinum]
MVGRIDIEANDLVQFGRNLRIVGQLALPQRRGEARESVIGWLTSVLRDAGLEEKSFVRPLFLMPIVAMFVGDREQKYAIHKLAFGVSRSGN